MKDKIYEPARHNEKSPAEGMAAVNTHTPEEEPLENLTSEQREQTSPRESEGQGAAEQAKADPAK